MGTTWVMSAPDGPNVGPRNLAIRVFENCQAYRIHYSLQWAMRGHFICHFITDSIACTNELMLPSTFFFSVKKPVFKCFTPRTDTESFRVLHWQWATLIAKFLGPTWGPSGADRTQVGPMFAPGTVLSGLTSDYRNASEMVPKDISKTQQPTKRVYNSWNIIYMRGQWLFNNDHCTDK